MKQVNLYQLLNPSPVFVVVADMKGAECLKCKDSDINSY